LRPTEQSQLVLQAGARQGIVEFVSLDADRVQRVVLGLPEVALRVEWLRDYLESTPTDRAARELERMCEASERSDPHAREAVLALALMCARFGEETIVGRLRARAEEERLLCLGRLLRRAPPSSLSQAPANESVPDYGAGRELTLGERKSLARAPSRRAFDKLIADPHPLVLRQLLENPRLTEDDVVRIAARRPARPEVALSLARSPRWLRRPRVRMALLLNPGSPPSVVMPLLAACTRGELVEIVHSADSNKVLRATACELLARRPPLEQSDAADHVVLQ
jgi:hypothetical protein